MQRIPSYRVGFYLSRYPLGGCGIIYMSHSINNRILEFWKISNSLQGRPLWPSATFPWKSYFLVAEIYFRNLSNNQIAVALQEPVLRWVLCQHPSQDRPLHASELTRRKLLVCKTWINNAWFPNAFAYDWTSLLLNSRTSEMSLSEVYILFDSLIMGSYGPIIFVLLSKIVA